jgi:hypothetical protein
MHTDHWPAVRQTEEWGGPLGLPDLCAIGCVGSFNTFRAVSTTHCSGMQVVRVFP